jgi:hypothetical protein
MQSRESLQPLNREEIRIVPEAAWRDLNNSNPNRDSDSNDTQMPLALRLAPGSSSSFAILKSTEATGMGLNATVADSGPKFSRLGMRIKDTFKHPESVPESSELQLEVGPLPCHSESFKASRGGHYHMHGVHAGRSLNDEIVEVTMGSESESKLVKNVS